MNLLSERLFAATRKGLFTIARQPGAGRWTVERTTFLGDILSQVLCDPRDGTLYAAFALGHFGVKLHRSSDGGASWEECAVPAYPAVAEGEDVAAAPSVSMIWALEAGGRLGPGVGGRAWLQIR